MTLTASSTIMLDIGSGSADFYSGVGQVAIQYVRHLAAAEPEEIRFKLLLHPRTDAALFGETFPVARSNRSLFNRIARVFDKSCPRHVLYGTRGHQLRHALHFRAASPAYADSSPLILTMHDAILLQERARKTAAQFATEMRQSIEQANSLVFVSAYAQKVIGDSFNIEEKPQRVIYNGVDMPHSPQKPEWFEDGLPFLLSIGRLVSYKNIHLLAAMMATLPEYRLIAAGANWRDRAYTREILVTAKNAGAAERVILPGKISESEKAWLYQNCAAFLMPSRNEGFGMPVIEALHCGKPVFSSSYAALPEVGGDCAFYWDDMEPATMAALVRGNISASDVNATDRTDRRKNWAENFSWRKNVDAYLDLYREVLGGHDRKSRH